LEVAVNENNRDNGGWVKLHRRLLENPIVLKPKYCHLWTVLLLKANHAGNSFIWNGKRQIIMPGQILTGREKLSESTGIKPSTIENILKYLESEQQIEQQKTSKFRIITIKNWEKYQSGKKLDSKADNKVTTDEQQTDTNNKNKNEEECKYKYSESDLELSRLLFKLIREHRPNHPEPNFEKWADDVRKLREIDKKTPEQIKAVIEYAQADSFWWSRVLSTASLRKKSKDDNVMRIDRLEMQMQEKSNGSNSGSGSGSNEPYIR